MSLLRKSITLILGEGSARALGVVTYVVIARSLGVDGFGVFSFAMSIGLIAMVTVDMGQSTHMGREISRSGGELTHRYARIVYNRLLLGAVGTAAVAVGFTLLGFERETIVATALLMVWATIMGVSEGVRVVYRALEVMPGDAVITFGESALRLGAVLVAAAMGLGVAGFAWAFVAEAAVAGLVVLVVVSRRIRLIPTRVQWEESAGFLRESVGLGLVAVATIGFYRIDQAFVLPLAGEVESGLYGAAARIAFTAAVVAQLVAIAAFPRLAATYENRAVYRGHLIAALKLGVLVAALAAGAIIILAGPMMELLFGAEYASAVSLLRILAVAIFFNAIASVARASAGALHREKVMLPIVLGLVAVVSLANFVWVPKYGAMASAWISLGGEVLLALGLLAISWDHLAGGGRAAETAGTQC